jgi:hypothetical protein
VTRQGGGYLGYTRRAADAAATAALDLEQQETAVVIGEGAYESALNLCYLIFACGHQALTNEMDWQPSH